jgi:putative ABC transport system ATP-binding protein
MIALRNIEKYFEHGPTKTWVLRRVNLDIRAGEFVSIMGPSGAGKSTLLHVLGMHDTAWTGEYTLDGHPVHRMGRKERLELQKQYIGFVFQSYHLLDSLTVYENLDIPLSYRNVKKKDRDSIVCDILDRFNIVAKKDLYPNQLSGGQQQLVGNLHSSQAKDIMELFRKLNRDDGITIVQVTHSETNASYGHRIVQIQDGWIVSDGATAAA